MLFLTKPLQPVPTRATSPPPPFQTLPDAANGSPDSRVFEDPSVAAATLSKNRIVFLSCAGSSHDDPWLPASRMESSLPRGLRPPRQPASNLCAPANAEPFHTFPSLERSRQYLLLCRLLRGLWCFPSFVRVSRSVEAFPEHAAGRSPAS